MLLPALPHKLFTLALVVKTQQHLVPKTQVLLGLKKRGFGQGKLCGFGGKVDATDASVVAAAAREIKEEANITVRPEDLKECGIVKLAFEGGKQILELHVYLTDKFTGEASESEEMKPQWYDADMIPYEKMWQDAKIWLPHVLRGKAVNCQFHFASDEDTMIAHDFEVTEPKRL